MKTKDKNRVVFLALARIPSCRPLLGPLVYLIHTSSPCFENETYITQQRDTEREANKLRGRDGIEK